MPLLQFFQGNLNASSKCQGNLSSGWRDNSITAENVNVMLELEENSAQRVIEHIFLKFYSIFLSAIFIKKSQWEKKDAVRMLNK